MKTRLYKSAHVLLAIVLIALMAVHVVAAVVWSSVVVWTSVSTWLTISTFPIYPNAYDVHASNGIPAWHIDWREARLITFKAGDSDWSISRFYADTLTKEGWLDTGNSYRFVRDSGEQTEYCMDLQTATTVSGDTEVEISVFRGECKFWRDWHP